MDKDTNKPLKDTKTLTGISLKDTSLSISYTKTNKLITALYMVTDIIDKEEPIRHKLRTLGTEIISDMHYIRSETSNKIAEIMSFLNIASAMNFVSEMNCSILKKEFMELQSSIREHMNTKPNWLSEFFSEEVPLQPLSPHPNPLLIKERRNINSIGHTRIGVQKGSTLMQALSEKTRLMSDINLSNSTRENFDELKKKRRTKIISIINENGGGSTIKDIREKINIGANDSQIQSEKTLQRELVSMIGDGILSKTGEKRWSKYFIK